MSKNNIRNIAIIAHVDHGKTTLVDGLLQQSGTFSDHQVLEDRVMDSGDLEKERGITITSKNTAINYENVKINIVDTPGHADFGGEVERSLNLVDGVLLLVDSSEGPLPQTRFVLKKALEKKLPVVLVINKIDKPDARVDEVVQETYDLFIDLDATDDQIEFPIIYTNAKDGIAVNNIGDEPSNLDPLFNLIINYFKGPETSDDGTTQFLITNLAYDPYVGQIAIGRLDSGILDVSKQYSLCTEDKTINNLKFSALYTFKGLEKDKVDTLESGDIIAVAGIEDINIGDTISDNDNPIPLDRIKIDQPTVSIFFNVNNSPFAGKEGDYVTSRNLIERLEKEVLSNVSIQVSRTEKTDVFEVKGRGELQMAVLIETMRREGYEFMVSRPEVITKEVQGTIHEPVENVYIDIPEEFVGVVTKQLSIRKGKMTSLINNGFGRATLEFEIPSRGLIGFRNQFLTETRGSGIMNTLFDSYQEWFGDIPQRTSGVLVADRDGKVTTYASLAMVDRGVLFVTPGTMVYKGMIVGERNNEGDLIVNIIKEKKLTNHRASGSDDTVPLRPAQLMSLDQCLEFISDNEFVEVTPESIRLRKSNLNVKT
ncbi:MAG: translational GTPase TypA [Candidatus Actinomarinales bacterium]|nr:MAG: translational GTPase TypA [Candidatus Actinomarinales bacterium]